MKAIVDCNSFYASCEQVFRPDWKGKPIIVLSNNDGCIIARNDEAKQLGIAMGGPFFKAKDEIKAKHIIVCSSNYALYGDLSRRVMETLLYFCPEIEVYSVDEAFLDIESIPQNQRKDYAITIKNTVFQWTGMPVSIGIATTKTLAKVANRICKKQKAKHNGVFLLDSENEIREALMNTSVEDVWGVGRNNSKKLRFWGIDTALKLSEKDTAWARKHLGGVVGVRLINELNGIPCIELGEGLDVKKMIASTRSFGKPVTTLLDLKEAIATYTARAAEKLRLQESAAGAIQVFFRSDKFDYAIPYHKNTQFSILSSATANTNELIHEAHKLTEKGFQPGVSYKKAGVCLFMLVPDNAIQKNLFDPIEANPQVVKLNKTMDMLNRKLGRDTVKFASVGLTQDWKTRSEERSPEYTTKWKELPCIGKKAK
jgi:DNA polymerase V